MKGFNEIYEEIYRNNHEELEGLRKIIIKKIVIIILIAIISLIAITKISVFVTMGVSIMFISWIIILVIMFAIIFSIKNRVQYNKTFKKKAIEPFIKNIDENLLYNGNRNLPESLYRKAEFEKFDEYSAEDGIEGILDGRIPIKMAEVHTKEVVSDSDGGENTYTLFHGIFGNVSCNKNTNTRLKIHYDKGIRGKIFKSNSKLDMDSSEFEKYFDVYTEDKIIAMQILTSDVMNLLIEFIKESGIYFEINIIYNEIYLRFHTGDVFEPKTFKDALDYDTLKMYYDIICFVFNVTRAINKAIENADI